jgi:phosphoribosylamine-glycine ligase
VKFLIISKQGDSVGLIERLQQEGNEVVLYVEEKTCDRVYDGLAPKVKHYNEGLKDDPVLMFDGVGFGTIADRLRSNYPVFGASRHADRRESNRDSGERAAKYAKLELPETTGPMEWKRAIKYIKDTGGRWTAKPQDGATTLEAEDPQTMAAYLTKYSMDKDRKDAEVLLQRCVEGTEVVTEMWFAKGKPVAGSLNGAIEVRRLMSGDLGPEAGSQSSMVWAWREENELTKKIWSPRLLKLHADQQTSGPVSVKTVIRSDGKVAWLEFAEHLRFSAIYALVELVRQDLGKLVSDMARGTATSMSLDDGFAGSVRVSIPPYPMEDVGTRGTPVGRLPDSMHIRLLDVMQDPKLDLVTAGSTGAVMEVVEAAKTIPELETKLRSNLEGLTLPNRQWRTDFMARALQDYPRARDAAGIKPGDGVRKGKGPVLTVHSQVSVSRVELGPKDLKKGLIGALRRM